jgi:RNA-directed DNA polymerase
MDRLRARIKDKRVLALVKAFLKAGVMTADGGREESYTGTPAGGSCPRCWPTSRCPRWMITSPGSGTS